MGGGRDPYLSPFDLPTFRDHVLARAAELNCIARRDALILAFDMSLQRRRVAIMLLEAACFELPPQFLDITPPSAEWLNGIAGELDLRICAPQKIEAARRYFCDYEAIFFFLRFQSVIEGRNPRLIFNMDETKLSARKRFHVLTGAGHLPLIKAETKLPHLTGLCTISTGGTVFMPIIVLKELKSLKSLVSYIILASFASCPSGWIINDLFLMFVIDFCIQLSVHRLPLPSDRFEEPALLILDGHISRTNITALMIFCLFNVDVLILPGHMTHGLQPFDFGIACPLKSEFRQQLMEEVNALRMEMIDSQRIRVDVLRCRMVAIFLNAFHKVTTSGNLYSAFETNGFVPFSPFVHLNLHLLLLHQLVCLAGS
jgi:hypothetical protein